MAESLEKSEVEVARLRLRVESRGYPYYQVIKEHFPLDMLQKFVDPNHDCNCNICGKDLEPLKAAAVQEALAKHVPVAVSPLVNGQTKDESPGDAQTTG